MRKLAVGILIFMAGWWLGWFAHDRLGREVRHAAQFPAPVAAPVTGPQATTSPVVPAVADSSAELAQLLQRNEFENAVELYESLQHSDAPALAAVRAQLLAYARQLMAGGRFGLAGALLQQFLVAAYRDVDARILYAETYQGQGDYLAAIDQLYEARGHAGTPDQLQQLTTRIRSLVAGLAQSLQGSADQLALLTLYQKLTQLEPDYAPWFIGLAAAQLALDDATGARRSLLLVAQDPDVGAQAQAMLAELRVTFSEAQGTGWPDAEQQMPGIPLRRSGNHFIVAATLADGRDIDLLIDTGASMTILTPEVLARSGIRNRETGRTGVFNTANGPVEAPVLQLDSLAVGDWQVGQLEVGVLDLGSVAGVDGLLGMNFLSHFQFFIDQNEALLRLHPGP